MMTTYWRAFAACVVLLSACAGADADASGQSCDIVQRPTPLPDGLSESSGVAASRTLPGVFWTHNDSGGEPVVVGVRSSGARVASVRIDGATNRDWEDLAVGPCPDGSCLYIADTGDNNGKRDEVDLYRTPEPPIGSRTARAVRFRVRYPDGPRDAEALFVLPSGQPFLVTKGRGSPVVLYRYPLPLRSSRTVVLEQVAVLRSGAGKPVEQVTSASASPSGRWIAIRMYRSLSLYRTDALLRGDVRPDRVIDLAPVGETQGEAVAILDDGLVVLTSEGGFAGSPGTISVLRCPLS